MLLAAVVVMVSTLVQSCDHRNRDQFPPHPIFLRNAMSGKRSCTSTFPSQPGPQFFSLPVRWMYRRMRLIAIHAASQSISQSVTPDVYRSRATQVILAVCATFFLESDCEPDEGRHRWARCLRGESEGILWMARRVGKGGWSCHFEGHEAWGRGRGVEVGVCAEAASRS